MLPLSDLATVLTVELQKLFRLEVQAHLLCRHLLSHTSQSRTTKVAGRIAFNADHKEYKLKIGNTVAGR